MAFFQEHREILLNALSGIVVLVIAWLLAKLIRRAIERFIRARDLETHAPASVTKLRMVERLSQVVIILLGLGLALYMLDVPTFRRVSVGIFASAGITGIALGFASQTTAANLISGIMISFVQPLRLGDRVEVDGEYGTVEEIGLFYTFVRTWDNRRVVIPNQILSNRIIRNYTVKDPRMPAVIKFRFSHEVDVQGVRELLLGIARSRPQFLAEPEATVQVIELDDAGVTLRLVAWAPSQPDAWDLAVGIREEALKRLPEAGAAPAFSRVQMISDAGAGPAGAAAAGPRP